MNEFKFSCPHCQQNIQATPEYAGAQINCPGCQAPIVVPQASAAPAPSPGRLSKVASTVHHAATSPVMATTMIRKKKKPRTGLYIGLGVGVVVAVAAVIFTPKLIDKYHQHQADVAAAQLAANPPPPPPPPPDLAADDILQNVDAAYRGLSSFSAQGESVGTFDMSQINPMFKAPQTITAKLSILLGRPSLYRMEWVRQVGGPQGAKGAVWSSGKGDYVRTGTAARKVKNRETALNTAGAASGTLGVGLAELFFNTTNNLAAMLKNYSKKDNETIDGRKCYVLTGQVSSQDTQLWIHKDDFLIARAEIILGGKLDDAALARLTPAQRQQAQMMSKIKGNITETYEDIETNQVLKAGDFQKALSSNANPTRDPSDEAKARGKKADREQNQ